MSKQHPNQNFYKVGGSGHSEGADRLDDLRKAKQEFVESEKEAKHPATGRVAKKK